MVALRIEYASRAHEARIAAIEAHSFTIAGHMLDVVRRRRCRDAGVRLVAIGEGGVVGYVIGGWYFKVPWRDPALRLRHISVNALAVDAPFRRSGIGRRLMTALFERAGARGADSYVLMVQAENVHAIALYESLGFERAQWAHNAYGGGRHGFLMSRQALPEDRRAR
jgi:ribosomal protein S18 acetylase RimI-like enzyme